jgi:hypothetical protein
MNNTNESHDQSLSRRSTLRRLLAAAGVLPILMTGVVGRLASAQQGKMAQKAVAYQDSPKAGQACASCALFQPPAACKLVAGTISPAAWCRLYAKKTG